MNWVLFYNYCFRKISSQCALINHDEITSLISSWFAIATRGNLFAIRAIVQNGLAFYATWVTIATLLNFAIVLTYWANVDMSVACTVSLSILLVEVLIYSVLENIVLERYLRYTYGVWLVVIFALCGSLAQNWDATSRNSIYSVVLLGLAAVLFLLKIVLSIWRAFKRPLYVTDLSSSKEELALA